MLKILCEILRDNVKVLNFFKIHNIFGKNFSKNTSCDQTSNTFLRNQIQLPFIMPLSLIASETLRQDFLTTKNQRAICKNQ